MKNKEEKNKPESTEIEMPPTEDLMREHGILNRILLIYEDLIRRIQERNHFDISILKDAVTIIKTFIEEYHEKLEEDYIFPLFEKKKQKVRLVKTLRNQHTKGKQITVRLLEIVNQTNPNSLKILHEIKQLLKKFITMYRPHEAREDTELFPEVRSLLSKKEFDALGEKFEDIEHERFGKEGFKTILKQVEQLEKKLGIYNLEQFTPHV